MTKRSRKKKTRSQRKQSPGRPVSAAAKRVGDRIVKQGTEYLARNFVRLMQNSAKLRSENEFADFYLQPASLLEAAARHFPRFRRRARRAARRDEQVDVTLYDDYRIAVLGDLDTPALRKQLQTRLERCLDRLKYGNDESKIEIATFLSVFLGDGAKKIVEGKKPLPLGTVGLVTAIYEDSFDRAMETTPEAWNVVGNEIYKLWCDRYREIDLAIIESAIDQLGDFKALAVHLETDQPLAVAWKRQENHLLEGLESEIVLQGLRIEPDFFTSGEVALLMDKMDQRYWRSPWSPSRYLIVLAFANFARCLIETLDEIVPPSRMVAMVHALEQMGQDCLQSGDERQRALVPHIQAAICELQHVEKPSYSRILKLLYIQACLGPMQDTEALSPHWRRFVKRLQHSSLWRQLGAV